MFKKHDAIKSKSPKHIYGVRALFPRVVMNALFFILGILYHSIYSLFIFSISQSTHPAGRLL